MFKDQGCSRVFFVVVLDPPVSYIPRFVIPGFSGNDSLFVISHLDSSNVHPKTIL